MPDIREAFNVASSPSYSIDQILQATKAPTQSGGGFRRVLGGLIGSVGNMFAPGIGGVIGSAISGGLGGFGGLGGLGTSGLMGETTQYLELQRQMAMQTEAFQTASSVMKARHDCAMSAIRNIN